VFVFFGLVVPAYLAGNSPFGNADAGRAGETAGTVGENILRLTEEDAVELALQRNLFLRSEATALQSELRRARTAANVLLPSITASGTLNRRNEEIPATLESDAYRTTAQLSLGAQLTISPDIAPSISAVQSDAAAAQYAHQQTATDLSRDVRISFYAVLLSRERVLVREGAVRTARDIREQSRAEYGNGRVEYRTVRQAELGLSQAELQLQQNRAAYQDNLEQFRGLLSLPDDQPFILEGELPVSGGSSGRSVEFVSTPDIASRAEIAELGMRLEAERHRATASVRNRYFPTVTVGASIAPGTADPFNPDNPVWGEWNEGGSVHLTVSLPLDGLVAFSSRAVAAQTSRYQADAREVSVQAAVEQAHREYRSLVRALETDLESLDAYRLNLEIAEEVLELTEQAYRDGATDLVSLRSAQDDLEEARLDLLAAAFSWQSNLIRLEYASGARIREDK
jgi:outer membrane protein